MDNCARRFLESTQFVVRCGCLCCRCWHLAASFCFILACLPSAHAIGHQRHCAFRLCAVLPLLSCPSHCVLPLLSCTSAGKWDAGSASSCQHSMQCTSQPSLCCHTAHTKLPTHPSPVNVWPPATRFFLQVKYFQAKANQGGQHSDF